MHNLFELTRSIFNTLQKTWTNETKEKTLNSHILAEVFEKKNNFTPFQETKQHRVTSGELNVQHDFD